MAYRYKRSKLRQAVSRLGLIVAAFTMVIGSLSGVQLIGAQSIQQQINELTAENNQNHAQLNALKVEAASYQETINALSAQINAYQEEINRRDAQAKDLQQQIIVKEAELEVQKSLLGENIKAMYLEGEMSTIEMLATSKDLSDYLDKQQYREVVKDQIKETLDTITALKAELLSKKTEVELIIKQQEELRAATAVQKAEQDRLLSFNRTQQSEFNQEIKDTQARISELRRQQAIENAKLFGGGSSQVGGGGYPWGYAPCLTGGHVQGYCSGYMWGYNGNFYNWANGGYAYRNCTDYVAWRVGAPGGLGNAKYWNDRAPSYGYQVSSTPRVGAAAVSEVGYYGHVMYVEAVNEDGSIVISDYNRQFTGEFMVTTLSASTARGMTYVYF